MSKKRDSAFQYAYDEGFKINFKEDTELITLERAKELWEEYLPDFIYRLQRGDKPEMAIWVDMKDDTDYHTTLLHADTSTETDGKRLFETKKVYLEL